MGNVEDVLLTPTDQQKAPGNRTPTKESYYGGKLTKNPDTLTFFQEFYIERKQYNNFLSLIKSRRRLDHPNFVTIQNFWQKNSRNKNLSQIIPLGLDCGCSSENRIQVCVEYPLIQLSLEDLLDIYFEKGVVIPQSIIVQILTQAARCLKFLQESKTCHGDIKSSEIYISLTCEAYSNCCSGRNLRIDPHKLQKEHLRVRLLDMYFINGGKTSYENILENPSCMSLLSPEQLERLSDKQFDDISQIHYSEVWSLGLVLLECISLSSLIIAKQNYSRSVSVMDCYDLDNLKVKSDFFKHRRQELVFELSQINAFTPNLNCNYSQTLIDGLFDRILECPAKERFSFQELIEFLGWIN